MLRPLVTNSGPAMSLPSSASTMIVIVTNPSAVRLSRFRNRTLPRSESPRRSTNTDPDAVRPRTAPLPPSKSTMLPLRRVDRWSPRRVWAARTAPKMKGPRRRGLGVRPMAGRMRRARMDPSSSRPDERNERWTPTSAECRSTSTSSSSATKRPPTGSPATSRIASVRAMRLPGSRGRSVRCAGSSGPPRRSDPADERQPIAPRWPVERR